MGRNNTQIQKLVDSFETNQAKPNRWKINKWNILNYCSFALQDFHLILWNSSQIFWDRIDIEFVSNVKEYGIHPTLPVLALDYLSLFQGVFFFAHNVCYFLQVSRLCITLQQGARSVHQRRKRSRPNRICECQIPDFAPPWCAYLMSRCGVTILSARYTPFFEIYVSNLDKHKGPKPHLCAITTERHLRLVSPTLRRLTEAKKLGINSQPWINCIFNAYRTLNPTLACIKRNKVVFFHQLRNRKQK